MGQGDNRGLAEWGLFLLFLPRGSFVLGTRKQKNRADNNRREFAMAGPNRNIIIFSRFSSVLSGDAKDKTWAKVCKFYFHYLLVFSHHV